MRRLAAASLVLACLLSDARASNEGFGIDAFNRAVSAATRGNAVFSPIAFEFDCVVFSEAFGAITRAKMAETMGVLNGLEAAYSPIAAELVNLNGTDSTVFRQARAFCLPDERKSSAAYRKWLQDIFATEAFSYDFKMGAECWFHAMMDGKMEDFTLENNANSLHYSYFDLVLMTCDVSSDLAPAKTAKGQFKTEGDSAVSVDYAVAWKQTDVWKRKNHSVIRMPLSTNLYFFAVLPDEKLSIRSVRGMLTSSTIFDITRGIKSISDSGISHALAEVSIPNMDVTTESDLRSPFVYFRFPMTGMERIDSKLTPKCITQRVRFMLKTSVARQPTLQSEATPPGLQTSKIALNRPFLFFLYHEPTKTIQIVGQFMGR